MREIKFRAWDGEKMRFPNLINTSHSRSLTCYTIDRFEPAHFDADNLMQFTGFLDKNGNEIYHGDVVRVSDWFGTPAVGEVIWDDMRGVWMAKDQKHNDKEYLHELIKRDSFVIIGNIYENPELLNND